MTEYTPPVVQLFTSLSTTPRNHDKLPALDTRISIVPQQIRQPATEVSDGAPSGPSRIETNSEQGTGF